MLKRIRSERGFTLVELLVVLAVLAILIAIVVPNLAGITGGARRTAAQTELDTVQTAMDSMMSKFEAISVGAQDTAATIPLGATLNLIYVSGYDPGTQTDTTDTRSETWLLRSTTHGTYSWTSDGRVEQDAYQ